MKNQRLYLIDILECIERIQSYVSEGREAFMSNRMIQDAVVRNFEIIGEATKQLSLELRQSHPRIPWQQVAGLCDVLIHDYVRVDPLDIWGIIERDLTALKTEVELMLEELKHESTQ